MKIILTGSTGSMGSVVLQQCLSNPAITSIIVLSRRALPSSISDPKLKVLIVKDFLSYAPEILDELTGAEACIWTLGGIPSRFPDLETARRVNIDFPLAGARAFISALTPLQNGEKFRFIYCSGHAATRDLEANLWLFSDARKIKGEIENKLIDLEAQNPEGFEAFLTKPGSVIPPNSMLVSVIVSLTTWFYPALKAEELAAAMIDIALRGNAEQSIDHDQLVERGRRALEAA